MFAALLLAALPALAWGGEAAEFVKATDEQAAPVEKAAPSADKSAEVLLPVSARAAEEGSPQVRDEKGGPAENAPPKPVAPPSVEPTPATSSVPTPTSGFTFNRASSGDEATGSSIPPPVSGVPLGPAEKPASELAKPYPLSLDDCIEIAIQNNLGLQVSRLNDRSADFAVEAAWAPYYPTLSASTTHANSSTKYPAAIEEASTSTLGPMEFGGGINTLTGGVSETTPWGTTLNFSVDESRNRWDPISAAGNLSANVTQHLWKGAGDDVGLYQIRAARLQRLISRGNLELNTEQLIFQVRQAYWAVIQQEEALQVNIQAVKSAQTFYDLTLAQEKAGQVTKLDVFNAQVQLRTQELNKRTTETQIQNQLDALKQIMCVDFNDNIVISAPLIDFGIKEWNRHQTPEEVAIVKELRPDEKTGRVLLVTLKNLKPSEWKIIFEASNYDEKTVMEEALNNRLDLLISRRNVAVQKLGALLSKNGLGQELDLVGGFNRIDYGRALTAPDNGSEVNSWNVGLNYSYQWGKLADRAAYEKALVAVKQAEVAVKTAYVQVHFDVRNSLRELEQHRQEALISSQIVESAKLVLDAAQTRFSRGLTDSFELIQDENNLLNAENVFIVAMVNYATEEAHLEEVVGKPTGRVNLEGRSVGGLIDSKLPPAMREGGLPPLHPDAPPTPAEEPLNKNPLYRKDYDNGSWFHY
jgi:outer membrane protein TolC